MRAYGFPEKRRTVYIAKAGAGYRTPARQWWKRYLHKHARRLAKKHLQEIEP